MGLIQFIAKIDSRKAIQLIIGLIGIYFSFLFSGVKYEKIVSHQYMNKQTLVAQKFTITAGFMMVERYINWLCGLLYQHFTLRKQLRVEIPRKNVIFTSSLIYLSSVTTTQSMYYVSYPLVIMSKSCSLISVILVGIFCSRVRSKQLKLQSNKIIIVSIVTAGIFMFRLFDPKANFQDNKKTQIFGVFMIILSLFTDGFIPDFQAQIKEKFKPQPIQMLVKFNKWIGNCGLFHIIITNQLFNFINFCLIYQEFVFDLILLSLATFIGQIFVYKMIKEFKQHIVPFVITTRKIVTVGLSIVYFDHPTSTNQVISILIVLAATFYEFFVSIQKSQLSQVKKYENQKGVLLPNKTLTEQQELSLTKQQPNQLEIEIQQIQNNEKNQQQIKQQSFEKTQYKTVNQLKQTN